MDQPGEDNAVTVLSDWELWACAKQQIDQHGAEAVIAASMRADALLVAGDMAGHSTWLSILDRVRQLSHVRDDEIRH